MTVRELIELLQTMPPDHLVVYRCCSDYVVLEKYEIEVQNSTDELKYGTLIAHHNMPNQVRKYYASNYDPKDVKPTPLNVVILPGN